MLAIGAAAGAASFTHVHNVAAAHGQPGWLAWADSIVLELMSVASGLELRRRKRAHTSTRFPAVVLSCAVTLSLAAQVVEAEPSPVGWIAAAVPALGFLVMVKSRSPSATPPEPSRPGRRTRGPPPSRRTGTRRPRLPTPPRHAGPVVCPATSRAPREQTADTKRRSADRPPNPYRTSGTSSQRHGRSAANSSRPDNRSPEAHWPKACAPPATPCPTPGCLASSRSSRPNQALLPPTNPPARQRRLSTS